MDLLCYQLQNLPTKSHAKASFLSYVGNDCLGTMAFFIWNVQHVLYLKKTYWLIFPSVLIVIKDFFPVVSSGYFY